MSLVTQIQALATRVGNEIRDNIRPRLLPSGGTTGQVLQKSSATNYAVSWGSLGSGATKNITISTADPSGGTDGDIWIKVT